jgi:hypothetical protein
MDILTAGSPGIRPVDFQAWNSSAASGDMWLGEHQYLKIF